MNLLALALASAICACAAALLFARLGVPGRVIESDGPIARPARVLRSARHGIAGKPDAIILHHGRIAPFEAKPGRDRDEPWLRDVVQVATYCLLVEEAFEKPAGYGYLRYASRTFRIDFTDSMRATLLQTISRLRADLGARNVDRDHDDRRRCVRCPLRARCDQSLA